MTKLPEKKNGLSTYWVRTLWYRKSTTVKELEPITKLWQMCSTTCSCKPVTWEQKHIDYFVGRNCQIVQILKRKNLCQIISSSSLMERLLERFEIILLFENSANDITVWVRVLTHFDVDVWMVAIQTIDRQPYLKNRCSIFMGNDKSGIFTSILQVLCVKVAIKHHNTFPRKYPCFFFFFF